MRVLLVNPSFPPTFWGQEHAVRLTGRRTLLPPLGLLTVAALLPASWELVFRDLNVGPLADRDLDRADVVFATGMLIQKPSLLDVAARARRRGKRVVVGGPFASTSPEALAPFVDCVVVGEAEELIAPLVAALLGGGPLPPRLAADGRPDVSLAPVPRFDLLDARHYQSVGVQFSRGCPFNCEFCDIIEIYGRKVRTKTPAQFLRELEAVRRTGFRGSVFVVDDNFIGNRRAATGLCAALSGWMHAHDHPFTFYTEASVNLARDDQLIDAMVGAGFSTVFLGIETPAADTLRNAQKLQNVTIDLDAAVRKLLGRGLDVLGGFIVGFDSDDAAAVARLEAWIARSPIPLAMVGLLTALPGTQLERRLAREGRLRELSSGDNLGLPNFDTKTATPELVAAYRRLLESLYAPEAYFERASRAVALSPAGPTRFRHGTRTVSATLARSLLHQGVLSRYRGAYWRYLWRVASTTPERLPSAFGLAIAGHHMIRYTHEHVLPTLSGQARAP